MVVKRKPALRKPHIQPLHVRIRLARLAKGLAQKELGNLVAVTYQHVSDWERGKISPRAENLQKIATATGVSGAWLLHGEAWMVYHDWPADLREWLAGQLLLHQVQRVAVVSYPEVMTQKLGFLLDIRVGILSVGALRRGLVGRPTWGRHDAEAYAGILRDLKRRGIPTGYVALTAEERGIGPLGDLSLLLPRASFKEEFIDRELQSIPKELLPPFDQAGLPIESAMSTDRSAGPSVPTPPLEGAMAEGPDLARLVQEADPDTRELIARLLREADPDLKKLIIRYLDARRDLMVPRRPLEPLTPSRPEPQEPPTMLPTQEP